jgi:pSer/pThr/pTyr-binding forkhead associated (FHA) protein
MGGARSFVGDARRRRKLGNRGSSRASWEDGMPKLTYVVGTGGETRSVDVGDSCSIGSLAGNTITLDATMGVSRRHAQILKIATGYEVSDLGSTNGTKVNGQTVKRAKLANGDKIEVGKVVMTFDDGSGASADDEISLEEPAGAAATTAGPGVMRSSVGASDQCLLVFAGGEKDGQKIPLDKPRVTFGRNAKNVVQLNDQGASGFHAEIAREGGAYVLRDLGSTNGTLVDGEPVSETALQHGARIRMGTTRFVFVDPTVSDFEKAMAAVDDLGSEWGMLRAEMDMTRVQKARRSQLVTTIVVLAVVLGGGAFVYMNRDKITGRAPQVARIDGNKVDDFSFEDRQGADWTPRPGTPTKVRPATSSDGKARDGSGTAYFAVTRDGPGGTCAAAQSSADSLFTASVGSAARFGARIRVAGGGMGGVRIVWLEKPEANSREIGRNSSALSSASDWQEVKGAAMPPEGARAARLELINAAAGTAYFDDVFLVWGGSSAGGAVVNDRTTTLSATADAQTTISHDSAKLLVAGAVVGGAMRAEALDDPSRRGDRSGSATLDDDKGLSTRGRFVDPESNQSETFQVDVSAKDGRFIDVKAELKGAAAWVATLPTEFVEHGIGVRTESDFRRASEPKIFDNVVDVSFGGPHRFRVSRGEKGGPLRMALYRVGDAWEVGFATTGGALELRIDADSAALTADIDRIRSEAAAAKSRNAYGEAIVKYRQLEGAYPSNSLEAATAKAERTKIEDEGQRRKVELERRVLGAAKFRDAPDLEELRKEAALLEQQYDKDPVGQAGKAAVERIDAAVAADRRAADERLAAPLLRKADDFRDKKPAMTLLAKAFYNEIVQRYPDTDAAKRAREELSKL